MPLIGMTTRPSPASFAERDANDTGERITVDEFLTANGLTRAELAAGPQVWTCRKGKRNG